MTNKKSTKRALIASVISLLLCFTMLMGTTYAWFTDSVTSANNIITTGNLDVELYYQVEGQSDWTQVTSETSIFKADALWEPGHTEVVKLKVVNAGTLALKYDLGINIAEETGSKNVAGKDFKLSDYIKYGVVDGAQTYTRDTAVAAVDADAKTLNNGYSKTGKLVPDATGAEVADIVTMVVYMPTTVGNEANYAKGEAVPTIELGLNLYATQVESESDSFGTDYDKNAVYADAYVSNNEELDAAINDGAKIIALASGTYQMPASAKGKTLTLNGEDGTVIEVVPQGQGEANGQLDYSLDGSNVTFNNLTIKTNSKMYAGYARLSGTYNNCVIQNTYNLGTGNSAFNNCVFNITNEYLRVGGAYSAVFNECTFNTDGRAILVFQDGTKVDQTVTVKDCTFLATAAAKTWNGIHVAAVSYDGSQGGTYTVNFEGTNYVDSNFNGLWQIKAGEANVTVNNNGTVGSTVVVSKPEDLASAMTSGDVVNLTLASGNYTMPQVDGIKGKTITISGTKDTVIDMSAVPTNGSQAFTGATLVFDGVTLNCATENYKGFTHAASLTYKNCQLNGLQFLYAENVTFDNCDFNSNGAEHSIWTYGAKNISFTKCDFTYGDRAVNVYIDNGTDSVAVSFNGCTFATTNTASKGAVEINSSAFPNGATVSFVNCTAPASGTMVGISGWDSVNGANATVTVDGATFTPDTWAK